MAGFSRQISAKNAFGIAGQWMWSKSQDANEFQMDSRWERAQRHRSNLEENIFMIQKYFLILPPELKTTIFPILFRTNWNLS
jgi:hypothetical protein